MSQGELVPEIKDLLPAPVKCRIPQIQTSRQRPMSYRLKTHDSVSRPKSANKVKNESLVKLTYQTPRRPEKDKFQLKRPSTLQKRMLNEITPSSKTGRSVITVPIDTQNPRTRGNFGSHSSELPDQLTKADEQAAHLMARNNCLLSMSKNVTKTQPSRCHREDMRMWKEKDIREIISNLELESTRGDILQYSGDSGSPDPASEADLLTTSWEQYSRQFEQMKKDLAERQKAVVKLYVNLENTHHKMISMGQKVSLPSADDLSIMNVAKLSPDQLLRLCAVPTNQEVSSSAPLEIDVRRLYGLPTKLISTCEQTLKKRKEVIDWFSSIKTSDRRVPMITLEKKINEFNAENDMLQCSFEQAKIDFLRELNEVIDFIRDTVKEAVKLQLRTEEQTHEMSELCSQNNDLWKRIHCNESIRPNNKGKLEELQKELKEEKTKNSSLREKVSRVEGQMKFGVERATQLEAALEESRAKCCTLESSVQQLKKQNQKLQNDFDKELNTLTASIRKNTVHLGEIGIAREKLQHEKEDLEKRLQQLSQSYNEAIENSKAELDESLKKIMTTEQKYQEKTEELNTLTVKLDAVTAEIDKFKNTIKELEDKCDVYQEKTSYYEEELRRTKNNLEIATSDVHDYRRRVNILEDKIKEAETAMLETLQEADKLKQTIKDKDNLIAELQQKESRQTKLLQESEEKMNSYEVQLSSLKNHVVQLKEDFGEFENLDELHVIVNNQRARLTEVTKQNEKLIQALQEKDCQLQEQMENITELDTLLKKKDEEIVIISKKDEEQTNVIKLLRNNLELRSHADEELSQQITESKSEIMTLIANLETKEQQISQLEKIILVLEEETCKSGMQRKKDQEKINSLEKQLAEYVTSLSEHRRDVSASSLDDIINILEEELGMTLEPQISSRPLEYFVPKKKYMDSVQFDNNRPTLHHTDHEAVSAKIPMGDFVKKSLLNNEQLKGDLGRKEAITNINHNQDSRISASPNIKYATAVKNIDKLRELTDIHLNDTAYLMSNKHRNLSCLNSNQIKDEKKSKMFKLAGHRL